MLNIQCMSLHQNVKKSFIVLCFLICNWNRSWDRLNFCVGGYSWCVNFNLPRELPSILDTLVNTFIVWVIRPFNPPYNFDIPWKAVKTQSLSKHQRFTSAMTFFIDAQTHDTLIEIKDEGWPIFKSYDNILPSLCWDRSRLSVTGHRLDRLVKDGDQYRSLYQPLTRPRQNIAN